MYVKDEMGKGEKAFDVAHSDNKDVMFEPATAAGLWHVHAGEQEPWASF